MNYGIFYLFDLNSCTFKWKYRANQAPETLIGAVWSRDFKRVYAMATNGVNRDGIYVFGDPYLKGTPYGGPKHYSFALGHPIASHDTRAQTIFALP